MSTVFDHLAQRRPTAVRLALNAATLAVLTVPAATVSAILTGHTVLAAVGVFIGILFYATGYAAAAVRYVARLRAEVDHARRDALTGLPTRAVADRWLDTATRQATAVTVALADIDGLHAVNANLGHAAGDQYIVAVAQRLARAVPAGGCLVRQGGDEFTLIAANLAPDELATAIGTAMAGPVLIAGHRIQPRVSVGVAASGGGDARYARACADAAMYTAKVAAGNHAMVYQPDRDGRPAADGTRPLIRRRDLNPRGSDGVAWLPAPGDDRLALLVSVDEAAAVHEALGAARDRWERAAADADPGARRRESPPSDCPDWMNIEPTPAGYGGIARMAAAERDRYAGLADRLAALIDAAQPEDATEPPRRSASTAPVVLVGISAAFTPIEIEGLVRTAADAVYGDPDDLSNRQREPAARANALLHEEMQS